MPKPLIKDNPFVKDINDILRETNEQVEEGGGKKEEGISLIKLDKSKNGERDKTIFTLIPIKEEE